MLSTAELVCSVDNTKCPVMEAWSAVSAVFLSRISPNKITSGSCRKQLFNPSEKSYPFSLLIELWVIPSISYSTGFSSVMIFFSGVLICFNIAYRVVVFPDPVGPVVTINPSLYCKSLSTLSLLSFENPSCVISTFCFLGSKYRRTMLSPLLLGSTETRTFIFLWLSGNENCPSDGNSTIFDAIIRTVIIYKSERLLLPYLLDFAYQAVWL